MAKRRREKADGPQERRRRRRRRRRCRSNHGGRKRILIARATEGSERERESQAYGYIATTMRLRSRLLSSTELGTEQLGSQWDHISTTAPVGRNKMASAIRLLFQIPRGARFLLSSPFFFLLLLPFLDLTKYTTSFPEIHIAFLLLADSDLTNKIKYLFAIFPSSLFFFLFTIVSINEISKETRSLETLDPHFLAPTPFGVAKVFRTRVNVT